jgi:hypothetical protein
MPPRVNAILRLLLAILRIRVLAMLVRIMRLWWSDVPALVRLLILAAGRLIGVLGRWIWRMSRIPIVRARLSTMLWLLRWRTALSVASAAAVGVVLV